jgi:hypothetical protein
MESVLIHVCDGIFLMNTKCIPDHTTNIPAKILLQMVP